jgi:hypothetical protein
VAEFSEVEDEVVRRHHLEAIDKLDPVGGRDPDAAPTETQSSTKWGTPV